MEEIKEDDVFEIENEIEKEKELKMAASIQSQSKPVDVKGFDDASYAIDFGLWEQVSKLLYQGLINEAEQLITETVDGRGGVQSLRLMAALGEVYLWRFNFVNVSQENEDLCTEIVEKLETAARNCMNRYGEQKSGGGLFSSLFGGGGSSSDPVAATSATATTGSAHSSPVKTPRRRSRVSSPRKQEMAAAAAEQPTEKEQARMVLEAQTCLAFCPLCYSLFYLRHGQTKGLIKGAYYLRRSYKEFLEAERLLKQYDDGAGGACLLPETVPADVLPIGCLIKFGLGLFHFAVSLIPPSFQWFIKLLGFSGDRQQSMSELTFASHPAGPKRTEAKLILIAASQLYLDDEPAADQMIKKLHEQLPDSPMLMAVEAGIQRIRGFPKKALSLYEKAASIAAKGLPQLLSQQRYHMGSCAFLLNEFELAAKNLEYFLTHTTGKQFKPYAGYMLLFSRWMMGERGEPLQLLARNALSWVRPNQSFDQYAKRRCQTFLDQGGQFDRLQEIFLAASALHEGKEWKRALVLLDQAPDLLAQRKEERDWFALFYWLKGSCLKGLGGKKKVERAVPFLKQAVEQAPHCQHELHAAVYALVDLAEIELSAGRPEQAEHYFSQAKSYSNYDWEKLVNNRISLTMEKWKRKQQQKKIKA